MDRNTLFRVVSASICCFVAAGLVLTAASCERAPSSSSNPNSAESDAGVSKAEEFRVPKSVKPTRAELNELMREAGSPEPTLLSIVDVLTMKMASQDNQFADKESISLLLGRAIGLHAISIVPIRAEYAIDLSSGSHNRTIIGIPEVRLASIFFSLQNHEASQMTFRSDLDCGPDRFAWATLLVGMAAAPDTFARASQWVFSRRCLGIPDKDAQIAIMRDAVFPGAAELRDELLASIENGTFSTFADTLEPRVRAMLLEAGVPLDSPSPR